MNVYEMNAYKENLRMRMKLVSITAIALAIVFAVLTIYRDHLPALPSFIKGFSIGAFVGLELIAVWYLSKCMRVRESDTEIKKMYIAENDERTGQIIRNASTLGVSIVLSGLAISVIISGFFNSTIFFTLLGSLFFVLIVFYVLWIYYARKF